MPEIPILINTAQTQNPVQAVDTRDARMMGDAFARLGEAVFDYGNMLNKEAKKARQLQDKLEVDEAEALLRKAYMEARAKETVRGEMNDPTGITSVRSIEDMVAPIREQLNERLSSDTARLS